MLSRLPLNVNVIDPNHDLFKVDYCETLPVSAAEVARDTRSDPTPRKMSHYILQGLKPKVDPEIQPYDRRAEELSMEDGCILWGSQVVISPTLRQCVREELHEGHFGGNRMKAIARSFVWWPNLDKELDDVNKACEVC